MPEEVARDAAAARLGHDRDALEVGVVAVVGHQQAPNGLAVVAGHVDVDPVARQVPQRAREGVGAEAVGAVVQRAHDDTSPSAVHSGRASAGGRSAPFRARPMATGWASST